MCTIEPFVKGAVASVLCVQPWNIQSTFFQSLSSCWFFLFFLLQMLTLDKDVLLDWQHQPKINSSTSSTGKIVGKSLSLPSSLTNTWESVAAGSLEEWLTSAVVVYSEVCLLRLRGRVCGSPTGRLFQVSPAKLKWLGPSPAPQMGSVSAGAANVAKAVTATSPLCQRRDSVFYMHMHIQAGPQEEKKNFGKDTCIYVEACQEGDYRVCSTGGPLMFLPVPMMQHCGEYQEIIFMTFKQIAHQIQFNYCLKKNPKT